MKRSVLLLSVACLLLLAGAQSAVAQHVVTFTATGCQPTGGGIFTTASGSITPVPQTEFDISVVSSVRGEVLHVTLPAGFDISSASTLLGPAPLGRLTTTVFEDLDQDDVRDPSEPILGSSSTKSPCHPGPKNSEQCSNGGWRSFGVFSSQGDCLAYLRTGGMNEPGPNVPGPPGQGPTHDAVVGSGSSSFCGGSFAISAQSGPQGEDPTGQVTCGTFFSGSVTCLSVIGNVALLNVATSSFGTVTLRITDFGTDGDRVVGTTGSGCPISQSGGFDLGFFGGDITVTDAARRPGQSGT